MTSTSTVPDFDASFDVDISAWNGAMFGEFPSQESTPSSSLWEFTSKEEPLIDMYMGTDVDMELRFPSVKVDVSGDTTGVSTEAEFLRAIMEAVQSSPKTVSQLSLSAHSFVT